jgi:hypothetical protein
VKKVPTVFERDWNGDRSRVVDHVHPGCEWVLAGEGVATRKYDGTCCRVLNGSLWKRRELKPGQVAPDGFESAGEDTETGKIVGWVPVGDGPEDRWHREAWASLGPAVFDGTYELLGPNVQGDPEKRGVHCLIAHAEASQYENVPRDFRGLAAWLSGRDIEGLVFHHADGRMAKIKLRDFGLKRPIKESK